MRGRKDPPSTRRERRLTLSPGRTTPRSWRVLGLQGRDTGVVLQCGPQAFRLASAPRWRRAKRQALRQPYRTLRGEWRVSTGRTEADRPQPGDAVDVSSSYRVERDPWGCLVAVGAHTRCRSVVGNGIRVSTVVDLTSTGAGVGAARTYGATGHTSVELLYRDNWQGSQSNRSHRSQSDRLATVCDIRHREDNK